MARKSAEEKSDGPAPPACRPDADADAGDAGDAAATAANVDDAPHRSTARRNAATGTELQRNDSISVQFKKKTIDNESNHNQPSSSMLPKNKTKLQCKRERA